MSERSGLVSTVAGRVLGIGSFTTSTALIGASLRLDDAGALLYVQALCTTLALFMVYGEDRFATLIFSSARRETWRGTAKFWLQTRPWQRFGKGALLTVVSAVAFVLIGAPLSELPLWQGLGIVGAISACFGLQRVLSEILRAGGYAFQANLGTGRAGGVVTQSVFSLLLFLNFLAEGRAGLSLGGALVMLLGSVIAGVVHLAIVFVGLGTGDQVAPDEELLSRITHSPGETLLASGAGGLFSQLDMLLAGLVLGPTALGVYGLARRVGVLINTPGYVANLVVTRRIAKASTSQEENSDELARFLPAVAAAATALAFVGSMALVFAPTRLYDLLIPVEQVPGWRYVLAALALGQVINVASGSCGTVLLLSGYQRPMLAAAAAGIAGIVVAALVVSASGSATAFAIGTTAATALYFGLLAVSARRSAGIVTDIFGLGRARSRNVYGFGYATDR